MVSTAAVTGPAAAAPVAAAPQHNNSGRGNYKGGKGNNQQQQNQQHNGNDNQQQQQQTQQQQQQHNGQQHNSNSNSTQSSMSGDRSGFRNFESQHHAPSTGFSMAAISGQSGLHFCAIGPAAVAAADAAVTSSGLVPHTAAGIRALAASTMAAAVAAAAVTAAASASASPLMSAPASEPTPPAAPEINAHNAGKRRPNGPKEDVLTDAPSAAPAIIPLDLMRRQPQAARAPLQALSRALLAPTTVGDLVMLMSDERLKDAMSQLGLEFTRAGIDMHCFKALAASLADVAENDVSSSSSASAHACLPAVRFQHSAACQPATRTHASACPHASQKPPVCPCLQHRQHTCRTAHVCRDGEGTCCAHDGCHHACH